MSVAMCSVHYCSKICLYFVITRSQTSSICSVKVESIEVSKGRLLPFLFLWLGIPPLGRVIHLFCCIWYPAKPPSARAPLSSTDFTFIVYQHRLEPSQASVKASSTKHKCIPSRATLFLKLIRTLFYSTDSTFLTISTEAKMMSSGTPAGTPMNYQYQSPPLLRKFNDVQHNLGHYNIGAADQIFGHYGQGPTYYGQFQGHRDHLEQYRALHYQFSAQSGVN